MMQLTSHMVRALKGGPLTVLVLLALERTPLTQAYIRRMSGYNDHVVHDALEVLKEFGLVSELGRYQWQICGGLLQMPLMVQVDPAISEPETDVVSEEYIPENEEPSGIRSLKSLPRSLKKRPASSSSSRSLTNLNTIKDPLLASENSSPYLRANLEALQNFGIREPARSRLAKLEHVTPEKIDYHCRTAENHGLAIYRIEHDWAVKCENSAQPGWKKYTIGLEEEE